MGVRTTLALLVPLFALVSSPGARLRAAVVFQEGAPQVDSAADGEEPPPTPPPEPALSSDDREALELLRSVLADEGRESARELLREIVAGLAEPQPGGEESHVAFLIELDLVASELGSLEESRHLRESLLALWSRLLPPDHHNLLAVKQNLAVIRAELGDLAGAKELEQEVLAARTRLFPPDHPLLLMAKNNHAMTLASLGDLEGAKALQEDVLEARSRLLPPDHPELLLAQMNLASTRYALGELQGAHELYEAVVERRTRLGPPDHPDLLKAKQGLGLTRRKLGDLAGALELEEEVLAARTRLLPRDHPDVLAATMNLAVTRNALGDLVGARQLKEAVLEARLRLLPGDHPDLLDAQLNLAVTRQQLGDLAGAKELEEAVLEARESVLPRDHPELLRARLNLAATRAELGDLVGAKELQESVLAVWTRVLSPDHPHLLAAQQNLAVTRNALGDLAGALELKEAVLAARTRLLSPDHPELLDAQQSLAVTRRELGDLTGAQALEEAVLAARTRRLPPDHPDVLMAKQNLAVTRSALGDLAGARELEEAVLAARTPLLPPDHPDLLDAQQNLAATRRDLGDVAGSKELVSRLLAGVRARAAALGAEATRPAREGARAELQRLSAVLSSSASVDPEHALEPELFATLESLRLASAAGVGAAHALTSDSALEREARSVAEVRARLNDLVAAAPEDEQAAEGWRVELLRLAETRDRAERGLRSRLTEAGAFVGEVDARGVSAHLAPGAAAVSFLRYTRSVPMERRTGKSPPSVDGLLAFVVKPGGAVARVELGSAAELETLVQDWRAALGRPLLGRGVGRDEDARAEAIGDLGTRLRQLVLDPVLAAVGEVHTLHLELDDELFLVPLDALPLGDGLVGERLRLHNEVTLARLLRTRPAPPEGGLLTVVGGIAYDAELGDLARVSLDASTPPLGSTSERSAGDAGLPFLPGTVGESTRIAALYEETSGRKAALLTGTAATKAALHAAARATRFLHLATHGWFASEGFKSQLDTLENQRSRDAFQRAEQTLTGFAPETLCGLALAGANRGKDALGRVPGILTAEELATFDLRHCELAVLSACETNVGIRRAGQGIQSLQTALHAAGARTAITSLWKVDDVATRRLFELFYTKLWQEKLGKADALWQAKMALRAEGHPPRDWAAWVLSGDPD